MVGQDQRGAIVLGQKWSRGKIEARLANPGNDAPEPIGPAEEPDRYDHFALTPEHVSAAQHLGRSQLA